MTATWVTATWVTATWVTATWVTATWVTDRIEPRAVEFADGRFVYTYAEHKPGDSMSERGTVEESVTVTVDNSAGAISSS